MPVTLVLIDTRLLDTLALLCIQHVQQTSRKVPRSRQLSSVIYVSASLHAKAIKPDTSVRLNVGNQFSEQKGACQCTKCGLWLQSCGGLAVHCCPSSDSPTHCPPTAPTQVACCNAHCDTCSRCFRSIQGRNRHRCSKTCPHPTASDRRLYARVCTCSRLVAYLMACFLEVPGC